MPRPTKCWPDLKPSIIVWLSFESDPWATTPVFAPGITTPGMRAARPLSVRSPGRISICSFVNTVCVMLFFTSTTGEAPDTVTVSCRLPTRRSALTFASNVPVSTMPSRLTALKPVSEKVTE